MSINPAPLVTKSRPIAGSAANRDPRPPTTPSIDGPRRLTSAEIAEIVVRYERSRPMARSLYESEEGHP